MKTLLTLMAVWSCLYGSAQSACSVTITPEYPVPGQSLTITLTPDDLRSMKNVNGVMYTFEEAEKPPIAEDIVLVTEPEKITGNITIRSSAKALFFRIQWGNQPEPIVLAVPMHLSSGKPVAGALVSMAMGYTNYAWMFGTTPDANKAYDYFKKEMAQNPGIKESFLELYGTLVYLTNDTEALVEIKASLKKISDNKKATEKELMALYHLQSLMIGVYHEAEAKTRNRIFEQYPKGQLAAEELLQKFQYECDASSRVELFKQYHTWVPEDIRSIMAAQLAIENGAAVPRKFEYYTGMITDNIRLANAYNGVAWQLIGEDLEGIIVDSVRANHYSQQSLELIKDCLINGTEKPVYIPLSVWQKEMKSLYGMFSDTYALILYRRNHLEEALAYQEIFNAYCEPEFDANERYAVYVYHVNGAEPALLLMADFIADGLASSRMRNRFSALLATLPPEAVLRLTRVMLENQGLEAFRMELESDMIDKAAPDFSLLNLKGEEVSLDKLRGKVIVIDFWASWCGPCIAGFPDMQEAVTAYKDDETVEFLFVNTWERYARSGKVAKATEFIEKKDYSFNVLVDIDDRMAKDYHIDALPTFLIIGPDGRIKFDRITYRADERFMDELSLKIDLTKESSKKDHLNSILVNQVNKK